MSVARWSQHISLLRQGRHHNKRFQEAFRSVGICGLSFSVLESGIPLDDLDQREAYWTERFDSVNKMPLVRVKEKRHDDIVRMIANGMKYREIAKVLGVSLGTVGGVGRQLKYEQQSRREQFTGEPLKY